MSILYRGSSIDAFYQMSVHLGKRFQRRRFFRNQPISIYGRFSINFAHFVPICLQTWPPQVILISDWLISKKSSVNRRQTPSYDKSSHCLCQGELKRKIVFHFQTLNDIIDCNNVAVILKRLSGLSLLANMATTETW
jgi:hypothetical protein